MDQIALILDATRETVGHWFNNKGTPIKLDKPQILFYAKSSYQGISEVFP
jgi:hypothetical protein